MREAGLASIEVAKKNGRWGSAYQSQKNIQVPADLQAALNKNRSANAFFKKLSAQNRYAILFRLDKVKKEEARIKKIEQWISMLKNHETIYPQKS